MSTGTTASWWRQSWPWALASATGVLIANSSGIAAGDDGVGYRGIADSILAGDGLGYFLERPLTMWPPGWPMAMAAISKVTPLNTQQAAIVLNMIVAAAVVALVHHLTKRLTSNPEVLLVATAVAALGASPMLFGHLLMTDQAFAAMTLALFALLLRYRDTGSFMWLVAAAAMVWVGFMTRYAGVVNIGTAGLWILADRRSSVQRRVIHGVGFGVIAVSVPVMWILRNHAADGTTLGERHSSTRGLLQNVYDTAATVGTFLAPGIAIERRMIWVAIGAIGTVVVLALTWRVLRSDGRITSARGVVDLVATPTGLFALHTFIYAAYMLYVRSTTALNQLDFRLLNPLYLPMVLCALVVVDRTLRSGQQADGDRRPALAARSALRAWGGLNLVVGVVMIGYFSTGPEMFVGNYNDDLYVEVRESAALDAIPAGCDVRSNLPSALYGSSVDPMWSWRVSGQLSDEPVHELDDLVASTQAGATYCLVWLDVAPVYGHVATFEEIEQRATLREIARDDAANVEVFEVTAK